MATRNMPGPLKQRVTLASAHDMEQMAGELGMAAQMLDTMPRKQSATLLIGLRADCERTGTSQRAIGSCYVRSTTSSVRLTSIEWPDCR